MPRQRKAPVKPPAIPADVTVRERTVDDYEQDSENANRGTGRGQQMIDSSFKEFGAGRSLVADADDVLMVGNHAIRGAKAAGIRRVVEIELPPDVLLVRKRPDMRLKEGGRARRFALSDNRTSQINLDFDPAKLLADMPSIEDFWREDEIADLQAQMDATSTALGAFNETQPEGDRLTNQRMKQIKIVVYVEDLALFEQAMVATGKVNRGEALLEICRVYMGSKE